MFFFICLDCVVFIIFVVVNFVKVYVIFGFKDWNWVEERERYFKCVLGLFLEFLFLGIIFIIGISCYLVVLKWVSIKGFNWKEVS